MVNNWVVQKDNDGNIDKIINTETGEFCNTYSEFKDLQNQNISELKNETHFIKKTLGVQDKKDTHYLGWNNNKGNPTYFTKSYKTFGREVKKTMTMNENALLFVLSDYLESETNRVVIDNKNPSNKVLAEIMGTSAVTISRTISSLKDKNLIQSVGSGLGRETYINPLLMFDGKDIKTTTLKLFGIKYWVHITSDKNYCKFISPVIRTKTL